MSDRPKSGTILGIPYNFDRPNVRRMLSSYWQPGKGMVVEKPFGIGFTLNLANWRSWIVLAVAAGMLYLERRAGKETEAGDPDDEPVEVIIDDG